MSSITALYAHHPAHQMLADALMKSKSATVRGMATSALSFFIASDETLAKTPTIVVMDDEEQAAYTYNDFQCAEKKRQVLFYPSSKRHSALKSATDDASTSQESLLSKTEVLDKISAFNNYILITYPESLAENVITRDGLTKTTLAIKTGDSLDTNFIEEMLDEYGFERVDFVSEPGQYSQRGSIIDIYSYSNDEPYRIDFFGDTIDSIRTFDVVSQLSQERCESITIIPDICNNADAPKIPFLDFIAQDAIVWYQDKERSVREAVALSPTPEDFAKSVFSKKSIDAGFIKDDGHIGATDNSVKFNIITQPNFQKNFNLLAQDIASRQQQGYQTFIAVLNERQNIRLHDIFASDAVSTKITFRDVQMSINEGFIDNDLKLCVYTDHQIFERYLKYRLKEAKIKRNRDAITINEMNSLKPGDYVVHQDHGIGVFDGLQKMNINGKDQEVIRLSYKDNDILFVSIHALHKISKYKGADGTPPKIYKLGSGAWNRIKQKTKAKVKDIAEKLIRLYAQRKHQKGFAFPPDDYMQQALEASFIYEDTPDQERATAAVKEDMEKPEPMDRLVCGDVGFGKTEIAVRAAFKAAISGKQVAVLVPTTILALQHYKTFSDRLKDFPVKVEYLSRLRTSKEVREITAELAAGKIDIIIGTHKLVGSTIKFRDLGLLIIDEEQKFGVSVKEKLKQLKLNVDTLTLTATPIPRTLQFSLLGARDLSIISTPPPNRYPVVTEVHTFKPEVIKEAIDYELSRRGQVFIIQNKIKLLYKTEEMIKKMFPKAAILTGHGQMDGDILENIMLSFINNEADILISTTIIENGLDIPNANTIIVFDAQNFGLSELHQLRGRVGRSNRKAFCYLISPPEENLTVQARQRLRAIESFTELGSGFNIAMQDLDIRGAGNMLGGEQSGFINEIGIETYQKILDDAIAEIREEEFTKQHQAELQSGGSDDDKAIEMPEGYSFTDDCVIDTDMEVLLPSTYIQNVAERIRLYRRLDSVKTDDELTQIADQLKDRFGEIPKQTLQLFDIVRMRWVAMKLGIEKISMKGGKMLCNFVPKETFIHSTQFQAIFMKMTSGDLAKNCRIQAASADKLTLLVNNITNTKKALETLVKIYGK